MIFLFGLIGLIPEIAYSTIFVDDSVIAKFTSASSVSLIRIDINSLEFLDFLQ